MNQKIRDYLIAVAREENATVFYSELISDNSLRIDLSSDEGRGQLKQLLIDISTFEHQQGRPMLTALAINKKEKDQGAGFYELAEHFGYGKKSELRNNWWGLTEANRAREYWQNDDNYEQFSSITGNKTVSNKIANLFESLINSNEYDYTEEWADMYVTFIKEVKTLQSAIAANPRLGINNSKLYSDLPVPLQSYEAFMSKWLKERSNGISSRGQSVLSEDAFKLITDDNVFKVISKLVIASPNLETYNELVDWWYENPAIGNRPLLINRAVAACLPEKLSSTVDNKKFWFVIDVLQRDFGFSFKEDPQWNWFSANIQLTAWLDAKLGPLLKKVSGEYIGQLVWRNIFVWLIYERYHGRPKIEPNELKKRNSPQNGYSEMPARDSSFNGFDVDFEAIAKVHKDLGDAGEELVKRYEILRLEKLEMLTESKRVRIAKTGEGFDVYSFDDNGEEKFIEVKTTTGKELTPFHLTRHEIKFMRQQRDRYALYRVYNFDEENNSGEFFELRDNIEEQLIMEPTQYEVVFKNKR